MSKNKIMDVDERSAMYILFGNLALLYSFIKFPLIYM
jgi:hypothetical protein